MKSDWRRRAGLGLAALWIVAAAGVFYIRFSVVFYDANRPAIEKVLDRLGPAFRGMREVEE